MQDLLRPLTEWTARSADVEAIALLDRDGLAVGSCLKENVDADAIAALSAQLLQKGASLLSELDRGALKVAMFRSERGWVLLSEVGADLVLAVMATPSAKLGLLLSDLRRTTARLSERL